MTTIKFVNGTSMQGLITEVHHNFVTVYFKELKQSVSYNISTIDRIEWGLKEQPWECDDE